MTLRDQDGLQRQPGKKGLFSMISTRSFLRTSFVAVLFTVLLILWWEPQGRKWDSCNVTKRSLTVNPHALEHNYQVQVHGGAS